MGPPVKFFFLKIFIAPKVPASNFRGSPWEQFCASMSPFGIIVKKDPPGTKMPKNDATVKINSGEKCLGWTV